MATEFRDLVVVVPGILGSVLVKDRDEIWSVGKLYKMVLPRRFFGKLALPAGGGFEPDPSVQATRVLDSPSLIPSFTGADTYTRLLTWLREDLELDEDQLVAFAYDWRLDNRVNARLLKDEVGARLREWRRSPSGRDAKLCLIAHSMGGLVCRYFTEVLEGWTDTRLLVTLGTPFGGAPLALDYLVNGASIGPFSSRNATTTVRTFPSAYQLLPTYACCRDDEGRQIALSDLPDLPGLDRALRADGLRFHLEIADAVNRHRRDPRYLNSFGVRPLVGARQATTVALAWDGEKLTPEIGDGDQTVPAFSAAPFENDQVPMDIRHAVRHRVMPSSRTTYDALMSYRDRLMRPIRNFFAPPPELAIQIPDLVEEGQPVPVAVKSNLPIYLELLKYAIAPVEEEPEPDIRVPLNRENPFITRFEVNGLVAGEYRIRITCGGSEIEDYFVIAGREAASDLEPQSSAVRSGAHTTNPPPPVDPPDDGRW